MYLPFDRDYDRVRLNVLNRRNEANRDELNQVSFAEEPVYFALLLQDRREIRLEMEAIHARLS